MGGKRQQKFALAALIILLTSCAGYDSAAQLAQTLHDAPVTSGQMEHPDIDESSGLAASRIDPDVLWTFNDSGGAPLLFAVGKTGEHLGTFRVNGAKNRDWEDIAAFRKDGVSYLLIADVGDNLGSWRYSTLYVVREPRVQTPVPRHPLPVPVAWTIRFQYEDGPRDCEAVAVDEAAGKILLISKRDIPPAFYTLPLAPGDEAVQMAWKVSDATGLPRPNLMERGTSPFLGGYADMVTAMDVASDGSMALVLTYKNVYLFSRLAGEPWADVFRRSPKTIILPPLPQAEGACFALDGQTLFVSSEKSPAPLLQIRSETADAP